LPKLKISDTISSLVEEMLLPELFGNKEIGPLLRAFFFIRNGSAVTVAETMFTAMRRPKSPAVDKAHDRQL
jgi:hypothetical protein